MDASIWLKEILNGLVVILSVSLVGMGLFVIFGMMRVINMAHGELFMLGAYVAYGLSRVNVSFWWSLVAAPLVVGLVGMLLERLIVRHLYQRSDLSTLLATWGVSIILQQLVKVVAGPQPRSVAAPFAGAVRIFGFTYPAYHLTLIVTSLLMMWGLIWVFARTPYGIMARAAMGNPQMAGAMGINTPRLYTLSFGLGSALAGVAGALLAPLVGVLPTMGLDYLARSFFVVIMGGMTNPLGVLASGTIVGGAESAFTVLINATTANIVVLAVVVLVMLVRPRGLFERR